jgi:hypothetical protein
LLARAIDAVGTTPSFRYRIAEVAQAEDFYGRALGTKECP